MFARILLWKYIELEQEWLSVGKIVKDVLIAWSVLPVWQIMYWKAGSVWLTYWLQIVQLVQA